MRRGLDPVLPPAQLASGEQLWLDHPSVGQGTGRLVVVMIGQPMDQLKTK
jgi:hypothetical protein